jgi:Amt family ammonium transporter
MVAWMVLDVRQHGKPTLIGTCTGALCGLVGVTPACGYVTLFGSFVIGIAATGCSYWFIEKLKPRLHIDDALDAFGCHGVSGIVGSVLTGAFATKAANPSIAENGLLYGGGWHLFLVQIGGTAVTILLVAIMATLIVLGLRHFIPMRVTAHDEKIGLDLSEHGEVAEARPDISDVLRYPDEFQGQMRGFDPRNP